MHTNPSRWLGVVVVGLMVASAGRAQAYYGDEEVVLKSGSLTMSFAVGDLDGDRRPDVFVGTSTTGFGEDEVWLRKSGGGYLRKKTVGLSRLQVRGGLSSTWQVFLVDWDGDGDLDVLRNWYESSMGLVMQILWNDGKAGFVTGPTLPGSGRSLSATVRLGDVDADGDLDLVVGELAFVQALAPRPRLYINGGKGVFKEQNLPSLAKPAACSDARIVDFDGDGRLDLFFPVLGLGGGYRDRPILYANRRRGWVDVSFGSGLPKGLSGGTMLVQDLDLDGDPDVAIEAVDNKKIRLFENRGKGIFRERTAGLFPGVKGTRFRVHPMSFGTSGAPPLLLGYSPNGTNDTVTAWLPGAGFVQKAVPKSDWLPRQNGWFYPGQKGFGDLDGDGDLDLLYVLVRTGQLVVRRGMRQELRVGPARLGRAWKLEALRRPGRLARGGFGLMALAPRLGKQWLPLPGIGLWGLPPLGWQSLGVRGISAPGGIGSWSLVVPQLPALLGQSYAVQAAIWDPVRRWALTRAVGGQVLR